MKPEGIFKIVMSYAMLLLGVFLIIHNIVWNPPIGSELVFGVEFLGGAYYIAHGKFEGFNKK